MEAVTILPRSRSLTVADLAAMPDDDGHRYELIDGALIVTPAPSDPHQSVVGNVHLLLRAGCPPELRVRLAPYDVTLSDDTLVQPDLLVARKSDIVYSGLPAAPVLAVEVRSPSTALIDLNLKKARFEQAGIPSYWVIDPIDLRLQVFELRDGSYDEVADISGDEVWESSTPYPIRIVPAELID